MIPLVDMHCHLLAGLDDGPHTEQEALEMCGIACAEGVGMACATAHQNERYDAVTPERIREACTRLQAQLDERQLPLRVFPCAEVMAAPNMEAAWRAGTLQGVGGRSDYILIEMPDGLFVDLRATVRALRQIGVRPILAHPERHAPLLYDPGRIEELIDAGCLVQVSSGAITDPQSAQDLRALKGWFAREMVHLLGSDGHSPNRRPPRMAAAYERLARWFGSGLADRVASTNGIAILEGLPLRVPKVRPRPRRWFSAWGLSS